MSTNCPDLGKFGKDRLEKYVFPYVRGLNGTQTRLRYGSDFNALEIDERRVLIVSTDPLAISPQLGWERSGRLALHVISTDVAVSGITPSHMVTNWNLPPEITDENFESLWQGFADEADRSGIKIAGGHTGKYESCRFPMVGAATAFGIGEKEDLIPGTFSPGDRLVLLNRLGLEAAAIFAFYYPEKLSRDIPEAVSNEIKREFDRLQPTRDLTVLSSLPGINALHDVAEGGLMGGLQEILADSEFGAKIDSEKIDIPPEVSRITRTLDLDPLRITSIGSGIAIVDSKLTESFIQRAEKNGIGVEDIGVITERGEIEIAGEDEKLILTEPVRDEFWSRLSEYSSD